MFLFLKVSVKCYTRERTKECYYNFSFYIDLKIFKLFPNEYLKLAYRCTLYVFLTEFTIFK